MAAVYTCITCHVAFWDGDIQREHYKTDWHRYNLKRKVAELPPVTVENFNQKVLLQRFETKQKDEESGTYCVSCQKNFKTGKAFQNHANSKRHQENLLKYDGKVSDVEEMNRKNSAKAKPVEKERIDSVSDDAYTEIEDVDSDEWDEFDGDPIPTTDCLFCLQHNETLEKNLKHMTEAHSFFIPDIEYLVDLAGLITYLGQKVGQGNMCLWCSEKGKHFFSVEAVQNHMRDKGHTKMLHDGEALADYADFYDYSSSYPYTADPDEEVEVPSLDGTGFELVLPSGATVGHRSLLRYYRQNLNPVHAVKPQKMIHRVMSHYKALGWIGTVGEEAVRKARDIRYMQKARARQQLNIGVKANKLQKHFRSQNP